MSPQLVMFGDEDDIRKFTGKHHDFVMEEAPHFVVSSSVNLVMRNPYVFAASLLVHGLYHGYEELTSRGGGGPSAQSQPPPSSSKDSRQARASAQGGKTGAPARASTRGSRPRRKSCPKGHYWSYKHKKCLRSKYRSS